MVGGGRRSKADAGQMVPEMSDVNSPRDSMAGSTSSGLIRSARGPCRGGFSRRIFLQCPMLGQLRVKLILGQEVELS